MNGTRQPPRVNRAANEGAAHGAQTPLTVMIGGRGAVARMLRRELHAELGAIVDIDLPRHDDVAVDPAARAASDNPLRVARTVILAIPESAALTLVPMLSAMLADDALLIETLSVKSRFAQAVARASPRFEVIGINPMFGPSLSMAGRAVAVVPIHARERAARFVSALTARGAQVTELSAEEHDRMAAALQALPHLTILAFARALGDCRLELRSALRLAPPPASALLALAARIAHGNPDVYCEIQSANPFAPAARESLARAVEEVRRSGLDTFALRALLAELSAELGGACPGLLSAAERLVREQQPPYVAARG